MKSYLVVECFRICIPYFHPAQANVLMNKIISCPQGVHWLVKFIDLYKQMLKIQCNELHKSRGG